MKFLYIYAQGSSHDIMYGLAELGHEVEMVPDIYPDPLSPNPDHIPIIEKYFNSYKPDYIISFLFIPIVAAVAKDYGIPYISWTYDSPLVSLFSTDIEDSNNYLFIFDKAEYERLKSFSKNPHIYYMPMSACLTRTGGLEITDEDIAKYRCDISFIGSLYQKNAFNESVCHLDDLTKMEFKKYLLDNTRNWSARKPWPAISEHALNDMDAKLHARGWNKTLLSDNEYLGLLFLTRKLAEIDRVTTLNALAEHFTVDLYTSDEHNDYLQNVNVHGKVDYFTDMNKIFYSSKINLNITLPSIETGIPQRVFDIMGCGGFVMTNYQEEIDELFTEGRNIVSFKNIDELLDKTRYYLAHDDLRERIGINGYLIVRDHYNHASRLKEIIRIVQANR